MFRDFSFRDFLKIFWARVVILFSKASVKSYYHIIRGGDKFNNLVILRL